MAAGRALPSRILFVADAAHAGGDLPGLVRKALASGIRFIEVRHARVPGEAAPPSAPLLSDVRAVMSIAGDAVVLVNDRVDLALLAAAHGAHVGQDDLPAAAARRLLGAERWLGLSTHDAGQLEAAQDQPVDYVALGPIFASRTKAGHAGVLGLEELARCASRSRLPLVAIGGIAAEDVRRVLDAGADAVAVASGLALGNVAANAERYLAAAGE